MLRRDGGKVSFTTLVVIPMMMVVTIGESLCRADQNVNGASIADEAPTAGTPEDATSIWVDSAGQIVPSGASGGIARRAEGLEVDLWFERATVGRVGSRRVPASYRFCNGDRVELKLRGDQDLYLLALVREVVIAPGLSPGEGAGLHRFGEAHPSAGRSGPWQLLFGTGPRARELPGDGLLGLPSSGPVILGNTPRPREIALILSRQPLDLSRDFDHRTRTFPRRSEGEASARVADAFADRLREWSLNVAVSGAGDRGNASYAVGLDGESPAVVSVFLNHQPCERRMSMPNLATHGSRRK